MNSFISCFLQPNIIRAIEQRIRLAELVGERGGTCRVGWGNISEREHVQDIGLDGRKIFKIHIQEIRWR